MLHAIHEEAVLLTHDLFGDTQDGAGTLDQVLQVLSSLASGTRAVGIISHVPLVQEAVPNGFFIRKEPGGAVVEERHMG